MRCNYLQVVDEGMEGKQFARKQRFEDVMSGDNHGIYTSSEELKFALCSSLSGNNKSHFQLVTR